MVEELNQFMETDTASMLVIFTGEEFALKRLFYNCESLRDKFDYKLELKHYSVNELVDVATEYARVKDMLLTKERFQGYIYQLMNLMVMMKVQKLKKSRR